MLAVAVRALLGLGRPYTASANGALYSAKQVFNEENMKMTTAKFASLKPIRMHARQPSKRAAVLIPLCEVNGKVSLLYTLRTVHLKSHRGQETKIMDKKKKPSGAFKRKQRQEREEGKQKLPKIDKFFSHASGSMSGQNISIDSESNNVVTAVLVENPTEEDATIIAVEDTSAADHVNVDDVCMVSFPGGMQDIEDKTLEETALRETKEELGIEPNQIDIWGSGNLIVTRTSTSVLPVIGRVKGVLKLHKLKVNQDEVEEVFAVPLENLCHSDCLGYTQFRGAYSMPVFTGGQQRIWGLTALITYMLLSSLLPQQAYSHKIKYVPPIMNLKQPLV
ncbi:unnamed protein product [Acanthoscelides obtectus]|uniref:Nudix hydrolase domain-containing protein n=1 Tax=Acanthoscelides obtectus TaxID=200917 RepID=A0A9P0PUN9_ACAOB|nr:unnamed protein product [Acanthoscelides obtectus]CAK1672766.1 Nucleoside diphosphate-linked moiety X motif 8 [Acanthoscelides obtectus]